jgi:hypothetical protein
VEKQLVIRAVRESNINTACLLTKRKVVIGVHGHSEHVGIVPEDGGSTIALVYVQIDDSRAPDQPIMPKRGYSHCDVIKNAEACPFVPERVMRTAGQCTSPTSL